MTAPQIPMQRRIDIANQLRRLGNCPSFLFFCRVLSEGAISLESLPPAVPGKARVFAMEAHEVPRTFREFGLDEEVARWMRRWDKLDYSVPLNPSEQAFIVARRRLIHHSGWDQDVPRERWPALRDLTALIGVDCSTVAISHLFGKGATAASARVVEEIVTRAGVTMAELRSILGPWGPCRQAA
jgi:hypothetical protein